jgi:hypothetical protein
MIINDQCVRFQEEEVFRQSVMIICSLPEIRTRNFAVCPVLMKRTIRNVSARNNSKDIRHIATQIVWVSLNIVPDYKRPVKTEAYRFP